MQAQLYHVARSILGNTQDATDAVQSAVFKAWRSLRSLRDNERFRPWMMRILVNQCRSMQRSHFRNLRLLNRVIESSALSSHTVERDVHEMLDALPEKLRLPVLLYYFDGYSHCEIGQILGIGSEQVNTRLRQGRNKLRKMLSEGDEHGRG